MKAHYLTKAMKGFENYMQTRITSVYFIDDALYIHARVNPTDDMWISTADLVHADIEYNLVNDTYKIKPIGKGAKSFGKAVKNHMKSVIEQLVKVAHDTCKEDEDEALFITQKIHHAQLKEAGASVAVLNEYYATTTDLERQHATTAKYAEICNSLLDGLQPVIPAEPTPEKAYTFTFSFTYTATDLNDILEGAGLEPSEENRNGLFEAIQGCEDVSEWLRDEVERNLYRTAENGL